MAGHICVAGAHMVCVKGPNGVYPVHICICVAGAHMVCVKGPNGVCPGHICVAGAHMVC